MFTIHLRENTMLPQADKLISKDIEQIKKALNDDVPKRKNVVLTRRYNSVAIVEINDPVPVLGKQSGS